MIKVITQSAVRYKMHMYSADKDGSTRLTHPPLYANNFPSSPIHIHPSIFTNLHHAQGLQFF